MSSVSHPGIISGHGRFPAHHGYRAESAQRSRPHVLSRVGQNQSGNWAHPPRGSNAVVWRWSRSGLTRLSKVRSRRGRRQFSQAAAIDSRIQSDGQRPRYRSPSTRHPNLSYAQSLQIAPKITSTLTTQSTSLKKNGSTNRHPLCVSPAIATGVASRTTT